MLGKEPLLAVVVPSVVDSEVISVVEVGGEVVEVLV
jgi:hypothetical protein